jgi:hypothetical protein
MIETIYQKLDRIAADVIDEPVQAEPEVGPVETSLDFLQAVYRNPDLPLSTRLRAALGAIGFEHPKLAVVANLGGNLGDRLEAELRRRMDYARSVAPVMIEGIDAEPNANG